MLNLKKGLALVLAAATAFTFAPVANLGNSYVAHARDEASVTLTVNDNNDATTSWETDLAAGDYYLTSSTATDSDFTVAATGQTDANGSAATYTTPTKFDGTNDSELKVPVDGSTGHQYTKLTFTQKSTTKNGTYHFVIETKDSSGVLHETGKAFDIVVKGVKEPSAKAEATSTLTHDQSLGQDVWKLTNNDKKTLDVKVYKANGTDAATVVDTTGTSYTQAADTVDQSSFKVTSKTGKVKVTAGAWNATKSKLPITVQALSEGDDTITVSFDYFTAATGNATTYSSDISVHVNAAAFTRFDWLEASGKYGYKVKNASLADDEQEAASYVQLNTVNFQSTQLNVVADKALTFESSDTSKVTVDASTGIVTAVAPGSAVISIYKQGTRTAADTITVYVSSTAKDVIKATYNGNDVVDPKDGINLDVSTSTAPEAVTSAAIAATSSLSLKFELTDANKTVLTTASDIASVDTYGLVKAGKTPGTVYVKISTPVAGTNMQVADDAYVKVTVNSLVAPQITGLSDTITLDTKENTSEKLSPVSSIDGVTFTYSSADANIASVSSDGTVTARKKGYTEITVTAGQTAKNRSASTKVGVFVLDTPVSKAKADSAFKVDPSKITIDLAGAQTATVVSSGAIGVVIGTSTDETVATYSNGVITAVNTGSAVIALQDTGDKDTNAGYAFVNVTVINSTASPVSVEAPAAVTGVTVKNKKGAFVKVTWDAQDSTVLYRVYKKVGNGSWKAKNVTSAGATLSVKKGASVKVKVKAFRKDANGKAVWQTSNATKYNNGKAFKTDKK